MMDGHLAPSNVSTWPLRLGTHCDNLITSKTSITEFVISSVRSLPGRSGTQNQTFELINVNWTLPNVQFLHIVNTFLYTSSI